MKRKINHWIFVIVFLFKIFILRTTAGKLKLLFTFLGITFLLLIVLKINLLYSFSVHLILMNLPLVVLQHSPLLWSYQLILYHKQNPCRVAYSCIYVVCSWVIIVLQGDSSHANERLAALEEEVCFLFDFHFSCCFYQFSHPIGNSIRECIGCLFESFTDLRSRIGDAQVRLLWAASRKNNFDLHTLESKAQDAEDRLKVVSKQVEKVNTLIESIMPFLVEEDVLHHKSI